MSINERIFTLKELFGNEEEVFKTTLNELNGLSNYEEAKNYLAEKVVDKYDWVNDSKIKKAKNFIKLVKRRYL